MEFVIRPALASDGAACAAIYEPYVLTTSVTFEYPAPDAAEMSRRISETLEGFPWLVCERDGRVIGYAYAHRYRPRAAFDWTSEFSIYMDMSERGRGAGTALYEALAELVAAQGYVVAFGLVCSPNAPSEGLHAKCGFKRMFTLKNCAWKFGQWRDLTYYERRLSPSLGAPSATLGFSGLDAGFVKAVCEKHASGIRRA